MNLAKSGILRDTVLVVMGDHPFMGTFEGVCTHPKYLCRNLYATAG